MPITNLPRSLVLVTVVFGSACAFMDAPTGPKPACRTLALIIEPTGGASLRDILATADAVAASVDIR